jgi:hypothetical protein
MEIITVVIAVLIVLYAIGKMIGDPDPSKMPDAWLVNRHRSETAWTAKYLRLPFERQQSESLRRAFDRRSAYIKQIESELAKRRMNVSSNAFAEATGILLRRLAPVVASTMQANGCNEEKAMSIVLETLEKHKKSHMDKGLSEAKAEGLAVTELIVLGRVGP